MTFNKLMMFNKLTAAQMERLFMLSEELGEAQQAIGKVLRHGYSSTHPDGGPTNKESLERELGDVVAITLMMSDADDLDEYKIESWIDTKRTKVKKYTHHQEEL